MCDAFTKEISTVTPQQVITLCHGLANDAKFNMSEEDCQNAVASGLVPALQEVLHTNCEDNDKCAKPCHLIARDGDFTTVCDAFTDPKHVNACMSVMASATGTIGSALSSHVIPCHGCQACPCMPSK